MKTQTANRKASDKSTENTEEPKKERFQLSFDLKADGSPDFEGMQSKTKERVKAFFTDPSIRREFASKDEAPQSVQVQIITPAMVAGLYGMLGTLEGFVFPVFFKNVKPEIAQRVFAYGPEEMKILIDPTARVLNKYLPEWLIKYQDEIALANLLLTITVAKTSMAIAMSKAASAQSAPTPVPGAENGKEASKEPPIQ